MINDLLYKRIKKLGACELGAHQYKNKSMVEAWNTMSDKWDFRWLLERLVQKGYLRNIHIEYGGWFRPAMENAFHHADPKRTSRRVRIRSGRECVKAMQSLTSFRQVSRALAKIKV